MIQWPIGMDGLEKTSKHIRQLSVSNHIRGQQLAMPEEVHQFYQARDYVPAWITNEGVQLDAADLLTLITDAADDGLDPEDYHPDAIATLLNEVIKDERQLAQLDVLLSDAFLHYSQDLHSGRYSSKQLDPDWLIEAPKYIHWPLLTQKLADHDLLSALKELRPPQTGYQYLSTTLSQYRAIAAQGGWPQIPKGKALQIGMSDKRLPVLRERLIISGDLPTRRGIKKRLSNGLERVVQHFMPDRTENTKRFDSELEQAVEHFQLRHGLVNDGIVGPKTLAALNVPVEERIRQLQINMERWRWMPRNEHTRHLVVNIAGFQLDMLEADRKVMSMRVIIGKDYRQTPALDTQMLALSLNPHWYVPPTILKEDLLPLVKTDPGYLTRAHFTVLDKSARNAEVAAETIDWQAVDGQEFPYILRQEPGEQNPLGHIKFILDNAYGIYLHDTPKRHLFNKTERALSSGCIRVEDALALAEFVLQDLTKWDSEALAESIADGKSKYISLQSPLPVYLVYFTAWVDEKGVVHFRDDVYGRDEQLEKALIDKWEHHHN